MAGEDWKAEARRLLADAVGNNDNRHPGPNSPQSKADAHFADPGVPGDLANDDCTPGLQRRVLQARLQGWLLAEGTAVAAAFGEEVERSYGVRELDRLDDAQLADLLGRFDRLIRIARMLAVTPKR